MLGNILEAVEKYEDSFIKIRRELHQYPELDFKLDKTQEIVTRYLDEINIKYKKNIGYSGIVADIEGKDKSITIAIRADMDALPIEEKNKCEYISKNRGQMHACGHDAHTAILLGIGKIISEYREELPCNVRLIFQPAEETTGGAEPMIKDGVLDSVDCIFGLHVNPEINCGKVGIKYGVMYASSTGVEIKVNGKSSHGAYPSFGIDAIVVMASIINSLQTIVSRNTDARDSLVLSLGKISGGVKENIIADEVICSGTMRTLSEKVKQSSKDRIKEMVEYISKGYGAEGKVNFSDSYISLFNNDEYVDLVKDNVISLLGKENIEIKKNASLGVEDFSYYVAKVPGTFFELGVKNEKRGIVAPLHNESFDIDEKALIIGIKLGIMNIFSAFLKLKRS